MVTTYIIVLCLSAWLIAYGMAQVAKRLVAALGPAAMVSPTLCILLPMLAFLAVVAAPPALLVAALLLLVLPWVIGAWRQHVFMRGAACVSLAALVAVSVTLPVIADMPAWAMNAGAWVLLLAMLLTADYAASEAQAVSVSGLAVVLPLLIAPFMGAPSFVALDVAIMASCLLAALMALAPNAHFGPARGPFALIAGWLILEAAAHGAWVPALLSVLAYGGAIAYGLTRPPRYEPFHAL